MPKPKSQWGKSSPYKHGPRVLLSSRLPFVNPFSPTNELRGNPRNVFGPDQSSVVEAPPKGDLTGVILPATENLENLVMSTIAQIDEGIQTFNRMESNGMPETPEP